MPILAEACSAETAGGTTTGIISVREAVPLPLFHTFSWLVADVSEDWDVLTHLSLGTATRTGVNHGGKNVL